MSLFKFKPTTPGTRGKVKIYNDFYKGFVKKKFCKIITSNSGRDLRGRISVRHKGGRKKRYYRYLDFYRNKDDVFAKIERIEYDPNRNANICLILYSDGERRYIISPKNIKLGNIVSSGVKSPIKIGNNNFLKYFPIGLKIHCVEKYPSKGAKISRSAGSYSIIQSKSLNNVTIKTSSNKIIKLDGMCRATVGEVGNSEYFLLNYGKAGQKRNRGVRPTVRGVAMNPVDHPHGGGEGKTSGGRDPVSPWGKLTKSFKKNV